MERGDTQVMYPGDPSERSKLQWNTASLLESQPVCEDFQAVYELQKRIL
jgi:hypothetical protein